VSTLLDNGAPYVFVANIYPKHVAPVTAAYLCGTSTSCVSTWGSIISTANTAIESALAPFGSKVIYYDVFSFMLDLIANKDAYGLTAPTTSYCDGDASSPNDQWTDCMENGHADEYVWMSFVNPTTRVHELIAQDMKKRIDGVFGV
jgi:phospholipase/lecithinase/hemolysin